MVMSLQLCSLIQTNTPTDAPDFDAGFMNDKRDMAPMVWGKSDHSCTHKAHD